MDTGLSGLFSFLPAKEPANPFPIAFADGTEGYPRESKDMTNICRYT
ncbi:hypothetical protein P3T16_006167 [Paraburkholderia sp. GAS42]|jgi:hypothetical protein